MTAPAKAAPMREDVTQDDRDAACALLRKMGVEIGQITLHWVETSMRDHRLAHTARPDAGAGTPIAWQWERRGRFGNAIGKWKQVWTPYAPDTWPEQDRRNIVPLFAARPDAGDEDVERVARAICQADEQNGAAPWDWYGSDKARSGYFDQARAALAAMREGVDRGMVEIPADIAAHVRNLGRVEWGQTHAHDAEGHGAHVAESVRKTADTFGQTEDQHMHGLWLEGTETVLCHTGTSPNAPKTTQALVGAWNWLVDQSAVLDTEQPR